MRQVMYISDSRIGDDRSALEQIMVQSRTNNAMDGITGMLWTNGTRFAQVIEGDASAVGDLLARLSRDPRHQNIEIVHDVEVGDREFGAWAMAQPSIDPSATVYEARVRTQLSWLRNALGDSFQQVIKGSEGGSAR